MAFFSYNGRKQGGRPVRGKIEADDYEHVVAKLSSESIIPIHIAETKAPYSLPFLKNLQKPRVTLDHLHLLARQLSTFNRSGIPLAQAVKQLSEATENTTLQETLLGVHDALSAGQTFSSALAEYPKIFSPLFVGLIEAGEKGGQLDFAFKQLTYYLELEGRTKKRLKAVMRYPMIVTIAGIAGMLVINFFVIPAFSQLFASFKAELPLPTRIMMGTSNYLVANWHFFFLGVFALIFTVTRLLRRPDIRFVWDRSKLRVPIFGPLLYRLYLSRFSSTFSMILKTGFPLSDGIELVGKAIDNKYFQSKILEMREVVEHGKPLSVAVKESTLFSPLVIQMITVGEETGQVEEMLEETATFYDEQIEYDISRLSEMLEPIILLIIGAMVLMLAIGIFLPMWDIVGAAR